MLTSIADNPSVLNLGDQAPPPLQWDRVFARPISSVEIEIGTGKGLFLRREAAERPDTGFLGIEKAVKFFRICAARLAQDGRPNVKLLCADAMDFLARWVPIGSVGAIHVYFPDPWPKKRHAKRRLLSSTLFDLAARAIGTDGILAVATDVESYFDSAAVMLDSHPSFARVETTEADRARVATNYAIKYARQGRSLHFARWRRTVSEPPPLPLPRLPRKMDASSDPSPAE